jgi:hypothetical protein
VFMAAVRSGNGSGDGLPALTRGRRRLLGPRLGWLGRSAARLAWHGEKERRWTAL